MNALVILAAQLKLMENVFKHVLKHGRLSTPDKYEILQTMWTLASMLFPDQRGDPGQLLRELNVPRIKNENLETQSDDGDC